jgi:hypothetical protein
VYTQITESEAAWALFGDDKTDTVQKVRNA